MSIEFRLKYIRDAIDKNVNDVLLKWNARKVLLNEPFDEERKELCPACMNTGKESFLKYCYVNLDEAIYKCEGSTCLYPFRNFKYKNFVDRTIFRYERIMETSENKAEQKIFTSPTKIETDAMDEFNVSWLCDDTYTDDLDSIISAPSDGQQTCDMKDIINNLCNDIEIVAPSIFNSPARNESGYSTPASAPKLSKCLQHIEHISPTKQTNSSQFKSKTTIRRSLSSLSSIKSPGINNVAPAIKRGFKSFKTFPHSKNRQIRPVQSIVEHQPLGFLDWLNVVSKTEPQQIQELEFATVNECNEIQDVNSNSSDLASGTTDTSSQPNNVQPVLIELMESLGSDQLQDSTKPRLLYKLNHSQLEPTNGNLEAIPNDPCDQPVTSQTLDSLPSQIHINVSPVESNVERSNLVSEETLSTDVQIFDVELGTDSSLSEQDHTTANYMHTKPVMNTNRIQYKPKIEKEKLKLERKEKQKMERNKGRILKQEERMSKLKAHLQKKTVKVKGNFQQKKFNIEAEENFLGFETVEPFTPITLRERELVWLRLE